MRLCHVIYIGNGSRSSISPRKQLWIKAVKKLTSERLGREGLAAWEDRKSTSDPEAAGIKGTSVAIEDTETEPETTIAEQSVSDDETPIQPGVNHEIHSFNRSHIKIQFK